MTTLTPDDDAAKKAQAAARIGAMLRGEPQPKTKTASDGAAQLAPETTPWNHE